MNAQTPVPYISVKDGYTWYTLILYMVYIDSIHNFSFLAFCVSETHAHINLEFHAANSAKIFRALEFLRVFFFVSVIFVVL
jgi:hypothetical protein